MTQCLTWRPSLDMCKLVELLVRCQVSSVHLFPNALRLTVFPRRLGSPILEPRRQIISIVGISGATAIPPHHHTRERIQGVLPFIVHFELGNPSRKGGRARGVSSGHVPGFPDRYRYTKGAALFLPPFSWFLMALSSDDLGGVCKELPSSGRGRSPFLRQRRRHRVLQAVEHCGLGPVRH